MKLKISEYVTGIIKLPVNLLLVCIFFCFEAQLFGVQPVFSNPGITDQENIEITDFIDQKTGYVTTRISIKRVTEHGDKFYLLQANEGDLFLTESVLKYSDLTTVREKRTDLLTKRVIESFELADDGTVHFFNLEKKIDKTYHVSDRNIYTRYSYIISFRGFPFHKNSPVQFKSYIAEYGDALTMKLRKVSVKKVTVKAGTFECYRLALSVSGWQSIFAPGTYYFYYTVDEPHYFVKYEELGDDKRWYPNELINMNTK